MLEVTTAGQINAAALDAENYFQSLLAEGARCGALHESDAARLQSESLALLAAQTAIYTGGESSSVRVETAQVLFDSVCYTLGIALKAYAAPEAALGALQSRPLASLFAEGQVLLRRKVAAARARHGKLTRNLYETENLFYRATAVDGIRGFFKLYRPALFASETHITADYPTLVPLHGGVGIEFIERYLGCLACENRFLQCFAPETVHLLLCAMPEDYRTVPMNLCLPVLTAALCCVLTGRPPRTLAADRGALARLLADKSAAQMARLLYGAYAPLCAELNLSGSVRLYLRRGIPQIAASLARAARDGMLAAAVLYPVAAETPSVALADGARMDNRAYTALLASLAACADAEAKATLLTARVSSLGDLLDILHDADFDREDLATLLRALPPSAIAALGAAYARSAVSDDTREAMVCAALDDYRASLPPQAAASLDAAIRALHRGAEL